jgi:hypothetical protein
MPLYAAIRFSKVRKKLYVIMKNSAVYSTNSGINLGLPLFHMLGRGPKSQYQYSTSGGTAAIPPRAYSSRWYRSTAPFTCGNVLGE